MHITNNDMLSRFSAYIKEFLIETQISNILDSL